MGNTCNGNQSVYGTSPYTKDVTTDSEGLELLSVQSIKVHGGGSISTAVKGPAAAKAPNLTFARGLDR